MSVQLSSLAVTSELGRINNTSFFLIKEMCSTCIFSSRKTMHEKRRYRFRSPLHTLTPPPWWSEVGTVLWERLACWLFMSPLLHRELTKTKKDRTAALPLKLPRAKPWGLCSSETPQCGRWLDRWVNGQTDGCSGPLTEGGLAPFTPINLCLNTAFVCLLEGHFVCLVIFLYLVYYFSFFFFFPNFLGLGFTPPFGLCF